VPTPASISEAESIVMEVLWRTDQPLSCEEVASALAQHQDWQDATVKTLLGRLLKKGAVKATKDHRRFLYSPVLTRERWLSLESQRLINRLFGGRIAPLVAHFGAHHRLSKKDVAELKRIIAGMDEDG
jgi:BlaI family transcriptional regulator, penicillinase repressor